MDIINLDIDLNQIVNIDVSLDEIIDSINNCSMKGRWNYIAKIISKVELNINNLSDSERQIIKDYLQRKLDIF